MADTQMKPGSASMAGRKNPKLKNSSMAAIPHMRMTLKSASSLAFWMGSSGALGLIRVLQDGQFLVLRGSVAWHSGHCLVPGINGPGPSPGDLYLFDLGAERGAFHHLQYLGRSRSMPFLSARYSDMVISWSAYFFSSTSRAAWASSLRSDLLLDTRPSPRSPSQ